MLAFNILRPKNKVSISYNILYYSNITLQIIYEPKVKYHQGNKPPPKISDSMFGCKSFGDPSPFHSLNTAPHQGFLRSFMSKSPNLWTRSVSTQSRSCASTDSSAGCSPESLFLPAAFSFQSMSSTTSSMSMVGTGTFYPCSPSETSAAISSLHMSLSPTSSQS